MKSKRKKDAPTATETPSRNTSDTENNTIEPSKSQGTGRSRTWATVVYADSAIPNWQDVLRGLAFPCLISPYHDKDKNPDKTPKKPHWHVLFMFDGVKSKEQIKEICDSLRSVGQENVASTRGYARYLCHLDNPEKAQYDISEVIEMGGVDYRDVIWLPTDKYIAIDEMMDFCDKYDISSLYVLMKYAKNHREDWKRVLTDSGAYIMREWLTSRKWSIDNGLDKIIDPETGEVIE
jgi:hypothetical protein